MRKVGLALMVFALVGSLPALAAQGDKVIRFGTAYIAPTGDLTETFSEGSFFFRETIEADAAFGAFFGFEVMVTDKVGVDGTLLFAKHDVDVDFLEIVDGSVVFDEKLTIGDVTQTPILISAHFHVIQNKLLDFYFGPTIGYIMYGDLKFVPEAEESDVPIKNDFGVGAVVGLDRALGGKGWKFSTAFRYLKTGAEIDEPGMEGADTLDIDPWLIQVGAAKRW